VTAVIVDFYDFQARALGFKDMAELEDAAIVRELAEVDNSPEWKAHVRECRISRGVERARRRP
jgi:hypothetical protein